MANVIQKVTLTLFQYVLIIFLAKLFRIQMSAPIFALILITGILVYTLTTLCNLLLIKAIQTKKRILFKGRSCITLSPPCVTCYSLRPYRPRRRSSLKIGSALYWKRRVWVVFIGQFLYFIQSNVKYVLCTYYMILL